MRFALILLLVALTFSTPVFSAEKVPFPDWYYSEYEYSYPEDKDLYIRRPVIVSGDPKLHPMTNALFLAPRAVNAILVHNRHTGNYGYEEYNSRWSDWIFHWHRWLIIEIVLYSDDYLAAATGHPLTGPIIQYFILETSNGFREVIDDYMFLLPEKREESPYYRLHINPGFSKDALRDRPEWIRLTLKGEDFEYYFHWDFEI